MNVKNKEYPLYELEPIRDLKDMMCRKQRDMPEKVAFTFSGKAGCVREKSYGEFYTESNALGTWLYLEGLYGEHIGIVSENSYELILAFFAIVNGGNVAVPMDKELPAKEMIALLKKADVKAVFVSAGCGKSLEEVREQEAEWFSQVRFISLERVEEYIMMGQDAIAGGNREYIDYVPKAEELCCILFTSGTSGVNKGVMLSHGNFAADVNGTCKICGLEGNTVAVLPFHHALSLVVGIFMVFHYGYPIHINKSLKTVTKSLQERKPEAMLFVPLFVETFHKQIWSSTRKQGKERQLKFLMKVSDCLLRFGIDVRKKWLASVRQAFGGELEYIICGGAALDVKYIRHFCSWGIEILNGYGATECAPVIATNRNKYHKDGTVGIAVPGTEIKIADDGEVMVKGKQVMLGYYGDEVATAEALQDGWYATGDLGTLDKDGFLTLTGRKKNLIILSNGENVSPEELEQDFLRDDAVREVLVYAEDGVIIAEIYPEEDFWRENYLKGISDVDNDTGRRCEEALQQKYFQALLQQINQKRPMYKQVGRIKLRDSEFIKNTSKKIIRQRNCK